MLRALEIVSVSPLSPTHALSLAPVATNSLGIERESRFQDCYWPLLSANRMSGGKVIEWAITIHNFIRPS